MAHGIIGTDLELEMKSYVASLSTSSTTSLGSDVNGTLQRNIRCPICLMKFKDPRRLECEHTFCKGCLQGVLNRQKHEDGQLNCLICQEPVTLHPDGVDDLDTALYVHSIEQVYKKRDRVKCSKCDGQYCSYCIHVVCNKCNKYVSTMFCKSCNKSFCSRCITDHNKNKHSVIEIELAHSLMKEAATDIDKREEETWERESGSSKDSRGQVHQVYPIVQDEMNGAEEIEDAWTRESTSGSSKDSDGEVAQSYDIVQYEDSNKDSEEEEENRWTRQSESGSSRDSGGEVNQSYSFGMNNENDEEEEEEEVEAEEEVEEEEDEEHEEECTRQSENVNSGGVTEVMQNVVGGDTDNEVNVVIITAEGNDNDSEDDDDPPRPPTMIDDDIELTHLVNEAVDVNIEPEQRRRLEPSAPKNIKRQSRVSIRQSMVLEPSGPPRYREIRSLKWCSRITIGFVIFLVLCTLAFAGIAVTAVFISPRDDAMYLLEDAAVLVAKVKPFWTRELTVTTLGPYQSSYYYQTELYHMKCDRLKTISTQFNTTVTGTRPLSINDLTVNIPTAANGQYAYLVAGSHVNFSIIIWSDTTYPECSLELNIYEDYDDFLAEDGRKAIQTNCIATHKSPNVDPTLVSFQPTKDSFYFATLSVPPTATYNVTVSGTKLSYDNTSIVYMDKCTITSSVQTLSEKCEFTILTDNIALDFDSECILAITSPLPPLTNPSFITVSLSSSANIFRNVAYILLPVPLVLYLVACFIAWLCYKGCIVCCYQCKRSIQKNSSHEHATI